MSDLKSPQTESPPESPTPSGPTVIEITPEGRRVVDPASIVNSDWFRKHLEEIKDIAVTGR